VPSVAQPGTAAQEIDGCDGYGKSAFLGRADVLLPAFPVVEYTLTTCRDACSSSKTCRSFSFNAAEKTCELWTPVRFSEDLIVADDWETYVCPTWAEGEYFVDGDKWESRIVGTSDAPDLECHGCGGAACGSDSCTPVTLAECNQACKAAGTCHMFIFGTVGGKQGTCQLWGSKDLKDLVTSHGDDDTDAYYFPCQGGKICPCRNDKYGVIRVNCKCAASASTNECAAGNYCDEGTCVAERPTSRRLSGTQCPTPAPTPAPGLPPSPPTPPPSPPGSSPPGPSPPGPSPPSPSPSYTFIDRAHPVVLSAPALMLPILAMAFE